MYLRFLVEAGFVLILTGVFQVYMIQYGTSFQAARVALAGGSLTDAERAQAYIDLENASHAVNFAMYISLIHLFFPLT